MGALVGGLASLTSTWVGERSRHRRDLVQREIAKRETAYSDFIDQASKLFVASATHNLNDDEARGLKGPSHSTPSRAAFACLLLIEL